jgi:hypothetical protein
MNLPLQMSAVPRGRFRKPRLVSSEGRVHPSKLECSTVGCTCDNNDSFACCPAGSSCDCDSNGFPICKSFDGRGTNPNPHKHTKGGECTCKGDNGDESCNGE